MPKTMKPDYRRNKSTPPVSNKQTLNAGFSIAMFSHVISLPLILSVIPFALTACAFHSFGDTPVLNRPETKIIDVQPSVVMKALLRVLNEKKFEVDADRTNRQSLETQWLQDGSYRSRVQAEVLPIAKYRTQLKVTLLLQKKAILQESWETVDKIDKSAYDDFINKVVLESYRVLYDGR